MTRDVQKRHEKQIVKSSWEDQSREGWTARQAQRLATVNTPEARLTFGVVVGALKVAGKRR